MKICKNIYIVLIKWQKICSRIQKYTFNEGRSPNIKKSEISSRFAENNRSFKVNSTCFANLVLHFIAQKLAYENDYVIL